MTIIYGPVPSRRLGRSLGINHIPPKVCSYSCVYCQVGLTTEETTERRAFYSSEQVFQEVQQRIIELRMKGEQIDFLSFVPDGEPTLDSNLGKTIKMLKPLGKKIAVITNGSLLWREDVRHDLIKADWVSLKVDAVTEQVWRSTNRPHKALTMEKVLGGMHEFARSFSGELVTETMLLSNLNSRIEEIENIAGFLAELKPQIAYIAIPTST